MGVAEVDDNGTFKSVNYDIVHRFTPAPAFEDSLKRGDIIEVGDEGGKSLFYMNRKKIGKREEAGSNWKVESHTHWSSTPSRPS